MNAQVHASATCPNIFEAGLPALDYRHLADSEEAHRQGISSGPLRDRANAAPMMSFGGGTHDCLGAHLARLELIGALKVLAKRAKLRRGGPAPWSAFAGMTGPLASPIEFEPGR